ncbi:MAG: lamin tail domain-containing protein [Deltaproteobacteria bacterium]|nr:lamin tail domain-containing protein [Deltaproteobacteria bacterium]
MRLPVLVAFLVSGACARGGAPNQDNVDASPVGDGGNADARALTPDAPSGPTPDAPSGGGGSSTLLLTEVVLAPSTQEFVEIANPGTTAVDLSTYYLSDSGSYFRLPAGVPTLDSADFIVKFPAGASIAPGAVITVALDTTANFMTTNGVAPTYSVASGTMTAVAANGIPSLTNSGELVVLFKWDGQADLVKDVDAVLAGAPTIANGFVDKSSIALDGPDTGTSAASYASDARTMAAMGSTPASGKSTKRLALETGHETQSGGGNGISGDDETSEDTAATWDSSAFTSPTPGSVPAALLP